MPEKIIGIIDNAILPGIRGGWFNLIFTTKNVIASSYSLKILAKITGAIISENTIEKYIEKLEESLKEKDTNLETLLEKNKNNFTISYDDIIGIEFHKGTLIKSRLIIKTKNKKYWFLLQNLGSGMHLIAKASPKITNKYIEILKEVQPNKLKVK